uniref:Mon2/Sec7/BIG1-like dimerisation and cyclophilin-binding domain-containing protein n=1 Tax=Antonospora locustae TaxID=278021 RepID=Q6E6H5_ANTLO|nr:hypothetical protein [Antonospora locustae]
MVSLTKESIRESLTRLSKDTVHTSSDIHGLCVQASDFVARSENISEILRDTDIPGPFILALGVMKKVPLYVLDCVRLFLSHSFIPQDRFVDICEMIMAKHWNEDAKLKILQFIPYLMGSDEVRDEVLARLFSFVVEMRGSTYNHVALSAEVISKQMILVVFDRYLYDVRQLGAAYDEKAVSGALATQDAACKRHRADVLRIFGLVLGLADGSKIAQKKANMLYFFDILEITVENALDIETACNATVRSHAGVDALGSCHAKVFEVSQKGFDKDLARQYLRVLLKYIRKRKLCNTVAKVLSAYIGSKEVHAEAAIEFLEALGTEDYVCLRRAMEDIVQFITQSREHMDKRLRVCRNICAYMYSVDIPDEKVLQKECSAEQESPGVCSALMDVFSRIFQEFLIDSSADRCMLAEISRMVVMWSSAKNIRETYNAYVKALAALDERICVETIVQTASYMQDTWSAVVGNLSDSGWSHIAKESPRFDHETLWHLLIAFQESACGEKMKRVVDIYRTNLDRLIAGECTDLIETCFKAALRTGEYEHVRVLALEYYGSICRHDEGAMFGELGERMESIPLFYLGIFAKAHGSHAAVLEILLEVLKTVGDHLKHSWTVVLGTLEAAVVAKNNTVHCDMANDIALKSLRVAQWIVDENIYFIDVGHILRIMAFLGDAATGDVSIVLNVLNMYQEIGDFLASRDAELLRTYFLRVLVFLDDERPEVVETALCQIFGTLRSQHVECEMAMFAEKSILPKVFGCLKRFGLFLSQAYFDGLSDVLQVEKHEHAADVPNKIAVNADSATHNLSVTEYMQLQRSLDIFFLAMGHINSYIGSNRLHHFSRTYLDFVSASLRAETKAVGVSEEDLVKWKNEFAALCIDVFRIFFAMGTAETTPEVSGQWIEGDAPHPADSQCFPVVDKEMAEIAHHNRQLYVDVCLNIPLGYYSESVYVRLFDLYYNSSLSAAQTATFCRALGRVLLCEGRVSTLCNQVFTLCNHILVHVDYAAVIVLYTTLLKSSIAASALQHLTTSYCDRKSSSELYARVVSSIYEAQDWCNAVEAIGTISRYIRCLEKFRTFVEVSKDILYSTGTRTRERIMMRYLDTYAEVVRGFWQGIRENIDNEAYYAEHRLGDFCTVRNELLAHVFQNGPPRGDETEELAASVVRMALVDNSGGSLLAQQAACRTECVRCICDAYAVVAGLAVMKEQSSKEHLAMQSYGILYEDMALRVVYNILRLRMKNRLAEFSREVRVYGMLYPRIRKEEVYAILGMLIKSGDRKLVKFVLAELVECLSCRDITVIRDIQSCLKIVHS